VFKAKERQGEDIEKGEGRVGGENEKGNEA